MISERLIYQYLNLFGIILKYLYCIASLKNYVDKFQTIGHYRLIHVFSKMCLL